MSTVLHPLFVLIHLALAAWGFLLWQRGRKLGTLLVVITAASLAYDNLILTLGTSIGVGSTLETLSVPRYLLHAIFTPMLAYVAYELAGMGGVAWAQVARNRNIIIGLVVALIGVGMVQGVLGMHLKPACHDGILRYAERVTDNQVCEGVVYAEGELNARGLPPIASIVTIIIVAVLGFLLGRKAGVWWLLVGAVVMFVTAMVPASRFGLWIGNSGEIALLASLLFVTHLLQVRAGVGDGRTAMAMS
jgi:hypothetical protein